MLVPGTRFSRDDTLQDGVKIQFHIYTYGGVVIAVSFTNISILRPQLPIIPFKPDTYGE